MKNTAHHRADAPLLQPLHRVVIVIHSTENVMETRARVKNGKPVCIDCARETHYALDGREISAKGT